MDTRRGLTIRLKKLKRRAHDFWVPKILEVRTISSICVCNCICIFVLVRRTFFAMPVTNDLYIRMSAKNWSERRCAFSFYVVEDWLMARIMCGTKRLNPFVRLHEASEVLNKYVMWVWSDNVTAGFFVSFILTVFVPDIEGIKNKAICFWIETTRSVNVAREVLFCMTSVVANFPDVPPI